MSTDAPIACTLSGGDYRERLEWIAALNAEALLGSSHERERLQLRYRREARGRVAELVARESACCGFLAFDLRDDETDHVVLTITAPAPVPGDVAELFRALTSAR